MRAFRTACWVGLLVAVVFLANAGVASAKTIEVMPGKSTSIGDALESAVAGDVVIVWASQEAKATQSKDWWMGEVLRVEDTPVDGDRSPLLQVADVETGMVCLVECAQVQRVRIPIHAPLTTT